MLMEMVRDDQGQQTSWDNKCNESGIKGEWIKRLGKGRCQFSKQLMAGGKVKYYTAKKIRNGGKILLATNNRIGKETARSIKSAGIKWTNAPIAETGWRKGNIGAPQLGSVQ
eukprot:1647657-Ditylum_brightwellii.AAC.1